MDYKIAIDLLNASGPRPRLGLGTPGDQSAHYMEEQSTLKTQARPNTTQKWCVAYALRNKAYVEIKSVQDKKYIDWSPKTYLDGE